MPADWQFGDDEVPFLCYIIDLFNVLSRNALHVAGLVMPEKDRLATADYRPGPASQAGKPSGGLQSGIGAQLRESTSQLLAMLQLRLAQLRATGDPRMVELAKLCDQELHQIRDQIRAVSEAERRSESASR